MALLSAEPSPAHLPWLEIGMLFFSTALMSLEFYFKCMFPMILSLLSSSNTGNSFLLRSLSVLVSSSCHNKNTTDRVSQNNRKLLLTAPKAGKSETRVPGLLSSSEGSLPECRPSLIPSPSRELRGQCSCDSRGHQYRKGHTLTTSFNPNSLPTYLLIPSHWGVEFQHMNLGGHSIQCMTLSTYF